MSLSTTPYRPIFVMQTETNDLIQAQMKRAIAHRMKVVGRVLVTTILLAVSFSLGLTQGWEVSFGGDNEDVGVAILQTIDEGYIEVGFSESFGSDNDFDIYIVRTDVDGTLIWSETYDEATVEQASDLIQLSDKNYLVVGYINDVSGQVDNIEDQVYLMKVDDKGELLWTKRYNNEGFDQRGQKIITTSDGGFAIIGQTVNEEGDRDILLIKLDGEANEVWRNTYGTPYTDSGQGIVEVDNGFAFAGNIKGDMSPDNDIAIYNVDENGVLIARNVYGSSTDNEEVNDLIKTSDGNILLVGTSDNYNNAYIIKSDLNGDTLWTREIVGGGFDDVLNGVTELEDGNIVAVGYSFPDGIKVSILVLKLSPNGDLVWQQILGDEFALDQFGEDVTEAADGGLVIAGFSSRGAGIFFNDLTIIKLDGEGNFFTNLIEGKVFWSEDGCNPYADGDQVLSDWLVQVEGENNRFIGSTDAQGNYSIPVDTGSYMVTLLPKNDTWDVCSPSSFPVDFTTTYDTLVYNFPVRSAASNCSVLAVEASVGSLVSCEQATYNIEYCNDGSGIATDAYVEIFLDEELTFVDASIDSSLVTNNSLVFPLGDLSPLACGSFTVNVQVDCDGIENLQAATFSANIYPDTICGPANPEWDGATIAVSGRCENNEVIFSARNNGTNTSTTLGYVIVEDVLVFLDGVDIPTLNPGEEVDLGSPIPASEMGSTYRIIAMQSEGAPGDNFPTVAVEGCAQPGSEEYNTGLVTQFPENDQDPYVDIDVQEILTTSENANLLIGHPKGYQDSIITTNTDIEYTVLFANTEVDTLNRLVIRDTLPEHLDLTSLSVGPASHPYTYELYNGGILKITFNDLNLLPDGSGTIADSRGFVKMTLSQKPNLPLGTAIENSAAVYFDYVTPTVTNKVRHIVKCETFLTTGCITVDVKGPPVTKGINIRIQPNPLHSSADFTIEGCECGEVEMILRNALGQEVRKDVYVGTQFTFQRKNLPPALYFYELRSKGHILQSSKLLIQ